MTPQYIILYRYRGGIYNVNNIVFSSRTDVENWLNAANPELDYQVYLLGTPLNVIKHTNPTYEITT